MSILMDALKQQVEPAAAAASSQPNNGWRNLALLLGFCLALLLGFALASGWQSAKTEQSTRSASSVPAPPELADSASILAALVSAEPEASAGLSAGPTTVNQSQPTQEQLKPEQKVVRVTAPIAEPTQTSTVDEIPNRALPEPEPEVEVSAELRQRFASAMAASDVDRREPQQALRGNGGPAKDISQLTAALQQQIPPLRFEAHVYATQSQQRWIKVNGKSLQEGQWVTADVRLKEITPQFVLLEMGTELFSLPALTDWPQQ